MTARQTYEVITLPDGGWAKGNWRESFDGIPRFNTYETDFQTSLNNGLGNFSGNFPLAGRFGLFAQNPQQQKLTPVQAAAKNFGDLPFIGNLFNAIRDYEDRINYRNADPKIRYLLGLD